MTPRDSAYAALGLRSGAAPRQVDEAYRRLIKLHHPDKSGGDANRAAEINRAYSLLRRERLAMGPHTNRVPVTTMPPSRPRPRRGGWLFTTILLVIAIGGGVMMQSSRGGRFDRPIRFELPVTPAITESSAAIPLESLDEPLHSTVIDSAIADAVKFYRAGDSSAAEIYSRDCQARLRQEHSLVWFDVCTAFDEAMLTLIDDADHPGTDSFTDSAVAAREVGAARALSNDAFGADLRLHQIRARVEFQIVPMMDAAAAEKL